jgi:hypothetical protein
MFAIDVDPADLIGLELVERRMSEEAQRTQRVVDRDHDEPAYG